MIFHLIQILSVLCDPEAQRASQLDVVTGKAVQAANRELSIFHTLYTSLVLGTPWLLSTNLQ